MNDYISFTIVAILTTHETWTLAKYFIHIITLRLFATVDEMADEAQ